MAKSYKFVIYNSGVYVTSLYLSFTGPKQGHSHSQRGCSWDACQLRTGVLLNEVLHGAHERLQERRPGVCQQQEGPAQGCALYGDCRRHCLHPPRPYRWMRGWNVCTVVSTDWCLIWTLWRVGSEGSRSSFVSFYIEFVIHRPTSICLDISSVSLFLSV